MAGAVCLLGQLKTSAPSLADFDVGTLKEYGGRL
jgi:hypothetical protein